MSGPQRIVVVGGGIVGLAVAWRAAARGFAVTVADPRPGGGASHAAAGMLAPASEATFGLDALLALNRASHRRWPAFAAELQAASGCAVPLCRTGSLTVAFDDDDRRALDRLHGHQASLGLAAERVGSRRCRQLEPLLSPRVRAGVLVDDEASVDPRAACRALVAAVERTGGRLARDGVARLELEGPDAAVVHLDSGERLHADRVVLAAGPRSAAVPGLPAAVVPPVRPVKGQILRLRFDPGDPPLGRTVRALVRGDDVYLVPRGDGELVVGATVEERGFDRSITAGAVRGLLDAAIAVVPEVAELELVESTARARPATPDGGPVLGPTSIERLVLATGHHRNGVLLTPVTADAVVAELAGEPGPAEAAAFRPGRFGPGPAHGHRTGDPSRDRAGDDRRSSP